jgi:hypothetical protein
MTISGKPRIATLIAAAALAVVTTLGLAGSASAVTQADAEAQFRAAGIGGNHWDVVYYTCGC